MLKFVIIIILDNEIFKCDFLEVMIVWKDKYAKLMYPSNMNNRKEKEAIELKLENMPNSLYKYRMVNEYSIENLKRNEVWCNPAGEFNDPYECALMIGDYAEESLKDFMIEKIQEIGNGKIPKGLIAPLNKMKLKEVCRAFAILIKGDAQLSEAEYNEIYELTKREYDEKIARVLEQINTKAKKEMMISCFSEVKDSILMWSHYANNHKGFCIEYDFNDIGIDSDLINALQPAIYRDEIFNIGKHFKETQEESNGLHRILEGYAAIIKSNEWKYEQEWRIIFRKNESKGFNCELFTPKSVYLGSRISDAHREEILEIAKGKKISVFQMKMKNNEFKLFAERLL